MFLYVCGAGIVDFFTALLRYWCLSFKKGSHFSSCCAVQASPCTIAIALSLVLWLRSARSDLNDDVIPPYLFGGGKRKAILFMNNFTIFTAPFEADLGYMFQLMLVTAQCSSGVYVSFVPKELILIQILCPSFTSMARYIPPRRRWRAREFIYLYFSPSINPLQGQRPTGCGSSQYT